MDEFRGRIIDAGVFSDGVYQCKYPWPDDCHVQCGGDGIVFTGKTIEEAFSDPETSIGQTAGVVDLPEEHGYRTAFFEAFPRNPNTFLRGEGETTELAEQSAWEQYQKHSACDHPEFEKRGYTNGAGFCVQCDMFSSRHYAPWSKCKHCDYPIYPNTTTCYHCNLFVENGDGDDRFVTKYMQRKREWARGMINVSIKCNDCGTHISDMRFVSSMDYRLTEEEKERRIKLYHQSVCTTGILDDGILDDIHNFITSVFYECKCDKLKLITDLVTK